MEKSQYELCVEVLRRLDKAGVLQDVVLVGSWCTLFYKDFFGGQQYIAPLKTRDMDLLIPAPSATKAEVDVAELLKDLGFVIGFTGSEGYIRLEHPVLIVEFLVPERGNHLLVAWASAGQFDQLLAKGCRIWLAPPPFDHSKLMLVDDAWSLIGSANWDPRSLKLNFEFNVECYSTEMAAKLKTVFDTKQEQCRLLTLDEVNSWPLAIKIRNGLCRLFLPYL